MEYALRGKTGNVKQVVVNYVWLNWITVIGMEQLEGEAPVHSGCDWLPLPPRMNKSWPSWVTLCMKTTVRDNFGTCLVAPENSLR